MDIPLDLDLELVVVANACSDDTVSTMGAMKNMFPFPVKCIEEPIPGLSQARNRAVHESTGEILVFIDDDVWIDKGWLKGMINVYEKFPADAVGGKVNLWWEAVKQPDWFCSELAGFLSENNRGNEIQELKTPTGVIGANFSFKRIIFEKIGGFRTDLGRIGLNLDASEESEFLSRALNAGFRVFYAPEASLKHWVAPERATLGYLNKASYGRGRSQVLMKERFGLSQALRSIVGHLYLVLRHGFSQIRAKLAKDSRAFAYHNCIYNVGRGGLVGALQRMLTKSRANYQKTKSRN